MLPHDGCGAVDRDVVIHGAAHGVTLGCGGDAAEHMRGAGERGDCEGQRELRNVVQRWETAVVYLLVAAGLVQRNELDLFGIVKVCYPRIVERDVSVDTETAKAHIDAAERLDECVILRLLTRHREESLALGHNEILINKIIEQITII